MDRIRVKVLVKGQVQGVGFRYFTQRTAQGLNLDGWVRNRSDGMVEAELEGSETAIEVAVETLRQGPVGGRVDEMEVERRDYRGDLRGFEIRF